MVRREQVCLLLRISRTVKFGKSFIICASSLNLGAGEMMIRALVLIVVLFSVSGVKEALADYILPGFSEIKGLEGSFQMQRVSGICPQNRKTRKAPSRYLNKKNPIPLTLENITKGEKLFNQDAKPTACKLCHGAKGNGNGSLARRMDPPPRNFTCAEVMKDLPAGQLFWIIQNGSRGTDMPPHKSTLKPEEIWQLIWFIKGFLRA